MMKEQKSPHANHRARMRERVRVYGYDSFSDHEILEMFLYSCVARGDTNETAHALIEHFGSFDAVLEADAEELMEVSGVGEQTAFQLALSMEMLRRCARSRKQEPRVYDTAQKIAEYMWSYFFGLNYERLYMLLFNNRMSLISLVHLSDGTVNSTNLPKREIVETALRKHASFVVLAHNHPHGLPYPSDQDIQATYEIADLLKAMGVNMREHLVLTENSYRTIMRSHYHFPHVMCDASMVGTEAIDWERFYETDEDTYRFPFLDEIGGEVKKTEL